MSTARLARTRTLVAGAIAGTLAVVAPIDVLGPTGPLPTPAAVVVVQDGAPAVQPVALPQRWGGRAFVPRGQVASVPALSAAQAAGFMRAGGADRLVTIAAAPSQVAAARDAAAHRWAIERGALWWRPTGPLAAIVAIALAGIGLRRGWLARGALLLAGLAGAALAASAQVAAPIAIPIAAAVAWAVADLSYVVGLWSWAEWRFVTTPRRPPASAPTPLPIVHRQG